MTRILLAMLDRLPLPVAVVAFVFLAVAVWALGGALVLLTGKRRPW